MLRYLMIMFLVIEVPLALAIDERSLRGKLEELGVPQPASIQLPEATMANDAHDLEIRAAGVMDSRLWLRLGCRRRSECRPAYASALYNDNANLREAASALARSSQGARRSGAVVIRPGTKTELVIVGKSMRVRVMVKALQAGRVGDQIRAQDSNRRIYFARVIAKDALEAKL